MCVSPHLNIFQTGLTKGLLAKLTTKFTENRNGVTTKISRANRVKYRV